MHIVARMLTWALVLALAFAACAEAGGGLVPQNLDYTENPVDIPNPDRGFYRANDGMVVPVTATPESLGQKVNVGEQPALVAGVEVQTRVSHIYFDLRNYSDNAFTDWGVPYDEEYEAPGDISVASRGDPEPWDYQTNYEYWLEHDVPTRPHGAYLSWCNATYGTEYDFATIDQIPAPLPGSPESRLGFFNDSYGFGTDDPEWIPDDWGSLAEGLYWPDNPYGDETDFDRGRLMTRIRLQNSLYGGEAQGGETPWNTYPFVAFEGAYAQTVYLNADYSDEVHGRWAVFTYSEQSVDVPLENAYAAPYTVERAVFDPVYDGKNGVEYWRDRLGYRLVLRDANASDKVSAADELRFMGKIQNVGFGNIVNRKRVTAILLSKADGTAWSAPTDIDAREWRPDLDSRADNTDAWRDLSFSIPLADFGDVPAGEYDLYLKINDPKEQSENRRCVRFANNGDIWNAALGANRIGVVEIVGAP